VTSTANDGSFSFGRVTAEDATVVVDMPGFARFEQRISIPREGVKLAIRLERAQAPLAITVRDRRKQPLQGASVTFPDQDGSLELTTDARGQATIDSPPAGEMLIRARIGWVEAQATRRDGDRDVAITLPPHGSVRIEAPRGIPTPRPRVRLVSLDPASTVLPEAGLSDAVTTLSGVPAGRYRLEIVGPDSGADGKPVVRSGPEVHVVDGETATAAVEGPR
jgi:hypothetical protein